MFSPACTPCTLSAEYPVRTALPARIIPVGQGGRTDSRLLLLALISAPTANRATVAKNIIILIFIILRFNSGIRRPVPRGYPTSNSLWPGTTVRKGNKNTPENSKVDSRKNSRQAQRPGYSRPQHKKIAPDMHTFRPQAASFGYFYYLCWAKYRYRMQPVNRTSDPQGQPVSTNLSATGFREPGFCNQVQPQDRGRARTA